LFFIILVVVKVLGYWHQRADKPTILPQVSHEPLVVKGNVGRPQVSPWNDSFSL